MVTWKSHGMRDGDVVVRLDHRDVVRGRWTKARELTRSRSLKDTLNALIGAISYPPREWGSVRCAAALSAFSYTAKHHRGCSFVL